MIRENYFFRLLLLICTICQLSAYNSNAQVINKQKEHKEVSHDGLQWIALSANEDYDGFCAKVSVADSLMNKLFRQIVEAYKSDTVFVKKITLSQQLWKESQRADLDAIFSNEDPMYYGYHRYSPCECMMLLSVTNERIKYLKTWIDGISEYDVCRGSRKMIRGKTPPEIEREKSKEK